MTDTFTNEELQSIMENMTVGDYLQLDELSKDTLKRYAGKASTSASKAWKRGDSEGDKAMSTDGEKYPEKQDRHNANAVGHIKTWNKRNKGIGMSNKRLGRSTETPTY